MPVLIHATLYLVYAAILLWVSWVDLRTRRIPNKVIGPAILLALAAMPWTIGVWDALLGAVLAPLPLIIARVVAGATKMGMGDIKLAIFVGLILGYEFALLGLFVGLLLSLVMSVVGVARGTHTWQSKHPFGPYFTIGVLPLLLLLSFAV
jgi:prepilin signal peptidase PulO-like enzyme (type II secretory pathway)